MGTVERDFRSFLDEATPSAEQASDTAAADLLWQALPAAFLSGFDPPDPSESSRDFAAEAYLDALMLAAETPTEDVSVAPSTDVETIAIQLDLGRCRTIAELDRARRDFARSSHPDRAPEAHRAQAMVRMQHANRLVDDAKAALRSAV